MKRFALTLTCLLSVACYLFAEVPTLSIETQSQGTIQIPVTTIVEITYDKTTGTEMYLTTNDATQTYQISDIVRMTLSNMPAATSVELISPAEAEGAQKILYQGTIYILRNGRIYTLKGEEVQ